MNELKTKIGVFFTVVLVLFSLFCFGKAIFTWITSEYEARWVVFGIISIVAAIVVPIVLAVIDTNSSSIKKKGSNKSSTVDISIDDIMEKNKRIQEEACTVFQTELDQIPLINPIFSDIKIKRRLVSDMPEIQFTNITKKTNLYNLFPLVVLDVETTGLSPKGNDIIEISAIRFDYAFSPVSCFSMLLKPRNHIPAEATAVNGITDNMVENAPSFSSIVPELSEFIADANIAGHNLNFDLKFLFVCGLDLPSGIKYYDTLEIAKKTLVKIGSKKYNHHTGTYEDNDDFDVVDYKLETLCEYYGIHRDQSHRALSDAYATGKLFKHLMIDKIDASFPPPVFPNKTIEDGILDSNHTTESKNDNEATIVQIEDEKVEPPEEVTTTEIGTKNRRGRVIVQMDDDGNTIHEYGSIAEAVKLSGVNSKSIRDAANGVQKHAGGYVWKFKDEAEEIHMNQ